MWYIVNGVLGAVIGSFLNVVVYRLPKEGLKLWDPPYSFCPACGHRLSWKDNIPIISYIVLGGKCRYCGAKIPLRYLLIEVLNTFAYVFATYLTKDPVILISLFGVFSTLIAISFMDLEYMGIHDSLNVSLLIFSFLFAWRIHSIVIGLISAGIGAGIFLAFSLLKRGMGMGDVLMIGAGSVSLDFFTLDIAIIIAAVGGLIYSLLAYRGLKLGKTIPFGPFLALGIATGVVIRVISL